MFIIETFWVFIVWKDGFSLLKISCFYVETVSKRFYSFIEIKQFVNQGKFQKLWWEHTHTQKKKTDILRCGKPFYRPNMLSDDIKGFSIGGS